MICHQVAAALLAILTLADFGFLEHPDMLGPRRNAHGLRLPKTECVHGAAGPLPTRSAMTVAHSFRLTGNLHMNCTAKTFAFMCRRHRWLLLVGNVGPCCRAPVFQNLDKLLNIAPWTLHDLRRTFATNLAQLGVAPYVIERLLNHVTGQISGVAAIYNRAKYFDEMAQAMQQWEARLVEILND